MYKRSGYNQYAHINKIYNFKHLAMYNYTKLMSYKPTSFGTHTNILGQVIEFYEHPTQGDSAQVICVCHDLKLAADSGFFETDDMIDTEYREYEPSFQDGKFYIGDMLS